MSDNDKSKPSSGTIIGSNPSSKPPKSRGPLTGNVWSLLKVLGVLLPIIVAIVAAVLYLEHRFQQIEVRLVKIEGAVNSNTTAIKSVAKGTTDDYNNLIEAIEAINENLQELTIEVIYCCHLSKETAKKVTKKRGASSSSSPSVAAVGLPHDGDLIKLLGDLGVDGPEKETGDVLPYSLVFGNPGVEIYEQ